MNQTTVHRLTSPWPTCLSERYSAPVSGVTEFARLLQGLGPLRAVRQLPRLIQRHDGPALRVVVISCLSFLVHEVIIRFQEKAAITF